MSKVRIAAIGAGHWGKSIVDTLHQMQALAAVIESSPEIRQSLAKQYPNIPVYHSLSEISQNNIDAVAIATPVPTHFAIAQEALTMGFDVFLEKPMTLSSAEAMKLTQLSEASRRILMIGHLPLYHPALRWLKAALKEGILGKLYRIEQERLSFGKVRSFENVLWSFGVHDLAVLLFLLEEMPSTSSTAGVKSLQPSVEDDVYVHLMFPSGVRADLHVSWLYPEKRRRTSLIGERGMLVYDELKETITLHHKRVSNNLQLEDSGSEIVFEEHARPLTLEMEHFIQCIQERTQPLSDGQSGVKVIQVLNEINQKLEKSWTN